MCGAVLQAAVAVYCHRKMVVTFSRAADGQ